MNKTINEETNKIKEFFSKHKKDIKNTFLEELKNSNDDVKSTYANFIKLIHSNEPITDEEREKIGNELKGILKRTLSRIGVVGMFLLPGGTIFLILFKLFKNKKNKTKDLPFDEINEDNKKIRTFNESTDSDEFKWHRDRENRLVTVLEGQGWELQMDNDLPQTLEVGKKYYIPEGVYHRVIKGKGDLKVSIEFTI